MLCLFLSSIILICHIVFFFTVTMKRRVLNADGKPVSIFTGSERLGEKVVETSSFNELRYFSLDSIPDFAFYG